MFAAVMRVRNAATMAIHNFFQKEGFINVHTPIISANDCEGAGELFLVSTRQKVEAVSGQAAPPPGKKEWNHFFNVPEAYLTVSGQLDAEIFACAMGRVYTFGPTFRAEKSNTPRHLAEFWMVEPEVAFLDLEGDMALAERFIKSVVGDVLAQCSEDILFFEKWVDPQVLSRIKATLSESFASVEYTDAVEILKKGGHVRCYHTHTLSLSLLHTNLMSWLCVFVAFSRAWNGARILKGLMRGSSARSISRSQFSFSTGPRRSSHST